MTRTAFSPALRGWTCALALAAPGALPAHEFTAGDLLIDHPWAAPPPPGAPSVAGYLSVTNNGERDDVLLGATAGFTATVELHESRIEDDVVSMRSRSDGIAIPAGRTIMLEPGGAHLMFVAPEPLVEDDVRPVTLNFQHAGKVEVAFKVAIPEGEPGGDAMEGMDHSTMQHDAMDAGKGQRDHTH